MFPYSFCRDPPKHPNSLGKPGDVCGVVFCICNGGNLIFSEESSVTHPCWCHCWCFCGCNLLGLMFCGCGNHLEDLEECCSIPSNHSCEAWAAEERLSEKEEEYQGECYSKNEWIRFWLVLWDAQNYCTVRYTQHTGTRAVGQRKKTKRGREWVGGAVKWLLLELLNLVIHMTTTNLDSLL